MAKLCSSLLNTVFISAHPVCVKSNLEDEEEEEEILQDEVKIFMFSCYQDQNVLFLLPNVPRPINTMSHRSC